MMRLRGGVEGGVEWGEQLQLVVHAVVLGQVHQL